MRKRKFHPIFVALFFTAILKSKVSAAQVLNDNMAEEKSNYIKLLEDEREASLQKKARVTTSYFVLYFVLTPPWEKLNTSEI